MFKKTPRRVLSTAQQPAATPDPRHINQGFENLIHMDVSNGYLFDTITVTGKEGVCNNHIEPHSFRFFTIPLGHPYSDGLPKDLTQTNIRRREELPPPMQWLASRLSFRFAPDTCDKTKAEVSENIIWRLFIDEKSYVETNIAMMQQNRCRGEAIIFKCSFCQRIRVNATECKGCGSGQMEILQEAQQWTDIEGQVEYFYDFAPFYRLIQPCQQFYVQGTLPHRGLKLPGNLTLKCFLTGRIARGIQ